MEKGAFIVFEGIDGSGKSSCMDAVFNEIKKKRNIIRTAEPTDGKIGMLIKESEFTPEAEALLFVADRAQHTSEIKKWMDDGNIVLCDRYYASTLAYQSASLNGRRSDIHWLEKINKEVITEPDLTFLFDIDPEKGLERAESRGNKSRFEHLEYLSEVRKNYLKIAKERGFVIIDASKPKDDVFNDVMKHISGFI